VSTPQQPDPRADGMEPLPPVPAPPTGVESLADGEWHRLHPLTPLFKGGLVLIIVAGILLNSFRDRLIYWAVDLFAPDAHLGDLSTGDPVDWVFSNNLVLLVLGAVLGVLILLIAAFWLVWRFQQFRISDEHVEVRKGIIFRSQRRAPLDRVQGVNLTRPFPARLIGMAKLEVVGAGTDANVPLEYLTTAKAESVRADILRLASGARAARAARRSGAAPDAVGGPTTRRAQLVGSVNTAVSGLIEGVDLADVAPESVVKIPTGRLVGAQLLAGVLWLLMFMAIFGITMAISVPAILADGDPDAWIGVLILTLTVGIPMFIAALAITWAQISKSLRYSIAPTPDGVRITYGLFTTITETIPPGRIFAVEVSQSLLWRPFGWWSIKINRMSGKSVSQQQSSTAQQFNIVLPVGVAADVQRVLGLILPDLPGEDLPLVWDHGIQGPQQDGDDPYTVMATRAWWRRPLSWKRHGFAVTDFAMLLRRGIVWRKLAVFPLARLQGLSSQQGPIDRVQRVGYLKAHSVTGPILGDIVGIESGVVNASLDDIARRASAAVQRDHGHRWASDADDADAGTGAAVGHAFSTSFGGVSPDAPGSGDAASSQEPRES